MMSDNMVVLLVLGGLYLCSCLLAMTFAVSQFGWKEAFRITEKNKPFKKKLQDFFGFLYYQPLVAGLLIFFTLYIIVTKEEEKEEPKENSKID